MDLPADLADSGRAIWEEVSKGREIPHSAGSLLLQACRLADRCDALDNEIALSAQTVQNAKGDEVINPLISEHRQASLALAAILGKLGLASLPAAKVKAKRSALSVIRGDFDALQASS